MENSSKLFDSRMARLVSKCVCKRITFKELKDVTQEKGIGSLEQIIEEKLACTACGMCKPYVSKMMVTGVCEFKPGDYHI